MDELLRILERRALAGDEDAKKQLFSFHVRLRGFPEGPWDNPVWYSNFMEGLNYLKTNRLREGHCLYVANARNFEGRMDNPVHPTSYSWDSFKLEDQLHTIHAATWLDMMTHTHGGTHNYHVDGFLVLFEGHFGISWGVLFYPYGDSVDIRHYMQDLHRKLYRPSGSQVRIPMAKCDANGVFGPIELRP